MLMEPYRNTDIDSGGSRELESKDGKGVEQIVVETFGAPCAPGQSPGAHGAPHAGRCSSLYTIAVMRLTAFRGRSVELRDRSGTNNCGTVVGAYDLGKLDKDLLAVLMEPYRNTDIDSGGSRELESKDGKGVEQIVVETFGAHRAHLAKAQGRTVRPTLDDVHRFIQSQS